MTEKEFIYAARCNGGKSSEKLAMTYIANNPKDDYDMEDWMEAMNVKRGFDLPGRPGWTNLGNGNKTTRYHSIPKR